MKIQIISMTMAATEPMMSGIDSLRSWKKLLLFPAVAKVLFCACTAWQVAGAADVVRPVFPVLPYLDIASMNARPALDAASIGMSGCILGFVVAKSADDATPCWGLAGPADGKVLSKEIARLRRSGLELWVSFGGADHRDLASVARDPEALMNLYAGVVRAYGVKGVDFDIEGDALRDREAMLRRAQAWRLWRARGDMPPSILTVPVLPSGLTAEVLDLLLIHRDLGVLPDRLNLMVMNYGPANAPNPSGRMAAFAASAASNTVAQLRANSLSALVSGPSGFSKLGLTPMVGFNSCPQEQFRLQDARRLREWAEGAQPGFLSFWSLNRDRFCVIHRGACRHCGSGVPQEDLDFLRTLAALPVVFNPPLTLACLP